MSSKGPITPASTATIFILTMASMGRSGRNVPMCCSHGRAFSPTFACLPPSQSPRTTVVERTEIITVQQTPIAREDLAVPPALFPHGKKCIIQLQSILLSGSLTPDPMASVCKPRGWLDFHISLQFSPLLVSRRPKFSRWRGALCKTVCAFFSAAAMSLRYGARCG